MARSCCTNGASATRRSPAIDVIVDHAYDRPGQCTIRLDVRDDRGAVATTTRELVAMSPVAANRYTAEVIPPLAGAIEPSAIDNRGEVVGVDWTRLESGGDVVRGFLYSSGVTRGLGASDGLGVEPRDINDAGLIVGVGELAGTTRAVAILDGTLEYLGTLGGAVGRSTASVARGTLRSTIAAPSSPAEMCESGYSDPGNSWSSVASR
jgi:hypothetical protein